MRSARNLLRVLSLWKRRRGALRLAAVLVACFCATNRCAAEVTFTKRVAASSDDAEQKISSGTMSLSSSDLELVIDGSTSDIVGMRFTAVTIPRGAKITNAYIQFKTDEVTSGSCSLTVRGQAADSASTFTTTGYNLSSRSTTSASAAWSPAAWGTIGEAGVNQRTPDISAIIQEIIDRSGWASGNAMVIVITGSGTRTAKSYDGDSAGAPLLVVEYTTAAYWKLNETSGTSAADASGFGNTGTVTGTATWAAGIINNGFSFNGSTRIQATGLISSPNSVTVAAWAKLTTADTNGAEIISLGDRFGLRLDEGSVTKAFFWNGSSYVSVTLSKTYAGAGWHHFAATFDDATDSFKLYVDGTQAASITTTSTISYSGGGANTLIGRHGNSATDRDFTGLLDDVRVYGYALTASEVAELYGLIGHWKLNETSGTTAADSTIFAKNGTVSGGASWSSDCGGMGNFDFNGSSQYISTTNASHLQPTGMLTIAGWVKGDAWGAGTDNDTILRKGEGNPNNYALAISDGRVELILDANDGAGTRGNTVLTTGQWYHVAATWDGSNVRIYVNGVLDNTPAARSGTIGVDTRPLYIGGRSGADLFNGMVRDVRFYNRPLLATEIAELAGLNGHWQFSEGSGTTAADSSGVGNNATLSGGATWTTDCAGNNNALLTNGTGGIAQTSTWFTPPDVGTVAFWMRSSGSPAGTARIFGLGGDWEVRQISDGTLAFDLCGEGGTRFVTTTSLNEVDRWYHVAATFDSATDAYAVYIDGQLHKSGTNTNAMTQQAAAVLSFGTRTGSTEYWQGALRDFRVYSRKLCPSEIAELYGLIGYWKLDETSGTAAADSSTLGNSGTVSGTVAWTTGTVDGAHQFNYADGKDYITIVNSTLADNVQEGNYSLAAWFKPLSTPPGTGSANDANYAILLKAGYHLGLSYSNANQFSFGHYLTGNVWKGAGTTDTYAPGTFHHVAAVVDRTAGSIKLYVDGVLKDTDTFTANTAAREYGTEPWRIGIAHPTYGTWGWGAHGIIDDVRIYNRTLCPAEIQDLHDLGTGAFGGVKIIKWIEIQ